MSSFLRIFRIASGLLSGVWQSMPVFFRVILGAAVVFFLFKILGMAKGVVIAGRWFFLVLGALFAMLVISGILYSRGVFRSGPSWLTQFLSSLTGENAGADRSAHLESAAAAISSLAGLSEAKRELNLIHAAAEDARHKRLPALGTHAPGILLLLYGSAGCGKTTLMQHLPPFFYGLCLVDSPDPVHISTAYDIDRIEPGYLVMFDDADWLTESENFSTARDIGRTLVGKVSESPHEIVVVMAFSEAGRRRLEKTPEHQGWLNRFDIRRLYFEPPGEDVIKDIFSQQLDLLQVPADASAIEIGHSILETERRALGKEYDHGHRPRKLAEKIKKVYLEKRSHSRQEESGLVLSAKDIEYMMYEMQ